LECACGERLEAEDDETLFELAREYMDRAPREGDRRRAVRNRIYPKAHDAD
jgi:hypothetical protein